jgi:hypothetical protein
MTGVIADMAIIVSIAVLFVVWLWVKEQEDRDE